jgi:hypothetical protein
MPSGSKGEPFVATSVLFCTQYMSDRLQTLDMLQVNSLCREWNVGKKKLSSLVQAMEQSGLLRIIRRKSDHSAMSVGAKICLADPSLYQA